jgi:DNA-directed RNA polymerase specialized sigma24 family protein
MPNTGANDASIDELLTLVALHLARPDAPIPTRLAPYLVRAAARYRRQRARNVRRRTAWHARAVREDLSLALPDGHDVAGSLFSEYSRRAAGEAIAPRVAEHAVRELVERLLAELTPENVQLLTWNADGVPHREIAEWLGLSYAAVAKRAQRLTRRLGVRAAELRSTLSADDQAALARLLRERATTTGAPTPDRSHSMGTR